LGFLFLQNGGENSEEKALDLLVRGETDPRSILSMVAQQHAELQLEQAIGEEATLPKADIPLAMAKTFFERIYAQGWADVHIEARKLTLFNHYFIKIIKVKLVFSVGRRRPDPHLHLARRICPHRTKAGQDRQQCLEQSCLPAMAGDQRPKSAQRFCCAGCQGWVPGGGIWLLEANGRQRGTWPGPATGCLSPHIEEVCPNISYFLQIVFIKYLHKISSTLSTNAPTLCSSIFSVKSLDILDDALPWLVPLDPNTCMEAIEHFESQNYTTVPPELVLRLFEGSEDLLLPYLEKRAQSLVG
jgi:hypothetical protein